MEILLVCAIIVFILVYNKTIDKDKFFIDNEEFFNLLREEDYNFLVYSKYGDDVDVNLLYRKRVTNSIVLSIAFLTMFLSSFSFINLVLALILSFISFKATYFSLKSHYKKHINDIDIMLPYYLKSLEILIQHYTVPVALGKSMDDAPDIFKPGLRTLVDRINSGDSTIDPYMEFANTYPVRDSIRMMRLLYRLGLGSQEKKQERLMMFSRTISSLQNKAREKKYKARLTHMENQTMIMLIVSGIGVMLIMLISMVSILSM